MSKKFRVLFYRPDYDHRWLDNAIGWYSFLVNSISHPTEIGLLKKLLSSHVEIHTPDYRGFFFDEGGPVGICWTSTMGQTGTIQENGCVRRLASEVLTTPRRWYYDEFEVCDEAYDYMVKWMEHQVADNICYDKWEIAKFFLPYRKQDPDDHKKICSGFSWVALYHCAIRHLLTKYELVLWNLTLEHNLKDLFSPLLMSYHLYKAGAKPIDLETGMEVK